MKLFKLMKDGGPLSKVWGYFLVELKWAFSIVVLRFEDGSREAYHTHAFNAASWVLSGKLVEQVLPGGKLFTYLPSWRPVFTSRARMHKVSSEGRSWVISFRGPWVNLWKELLPDKGVITLTHGRKVVQDGPA